MEIAEITHLEALYRKPVTLKGKYTTLIPLELDHDQALFDALNGDELLWRYMPSPRPLDTAGMRAWIQVALKDYAEGRRLPFAVVENNSNQIIGSTSYVNMSYGNRHVDIGWTWYARKYWRTGVNTECKYNLLRYAFEILQCIRVQFRVDNRNEQSKRAVERIGGIAEGVLRKAQILHDGHERYVALFSILNDEWTDRKVWFEERLNQ